MKTIYKVFVDGCFAGIAKTEDEILDIAADQTNGTGRPLLDDDMPDRLWWEEINCLMYKKTDTNEHFYLIYNKNEDAYKIIYNDDVYIVFYNLPNRNVKGLSTSVFLSITTITIN